MTYDFTSCSAVFQSCQDDDKSDNFNMCMLKRLKIIVANREDVDLPACLFVQVNLSVCCL